jgi:hypothetical protein
MRKMSVAHAENSFQSSFGAPEELAHDRDRIRLAHVGHELAATGLGDGVDEPVDHLAHERPQAVRPPSG